MLSALMNIIIVFTLCLRTENLPISRPRYKPKPSSGSKQGRSFCTCHYSNKPQPSVREHPASFYSSGRCLSLSQPVNPAMSFSIFPLPVPYSSLCQPSSSEASTRGSLEGFSLKLYLQDHL